MGDKVKTPNFKTARKSSNVLEEWDRSLSLAAFSRVGRHIPRPLLILFEHAGNGLFWLPGAIIMWLLPGLTPHQRTLVANLLAGFVIDLVVVGTIKGIVKRGRPVYNNEDDFILVVSVDKYSFPSGHASRASFIAFFAAVCWFHVSRQLTAAVLLWGFATAVSRALLGRHFLGDVAAGIATGAATTALVTRGAWDMSSPLVPEALSQQWFHAAARQLAGVAWPLHLKPYYAPALGI